MPKLKDKRKEIFDWLKTEGYTLKGEHWTNLKKKFQEYGDEKIKVLLLCCQEKDKALAERNDEIKKLNEKLNKQSHFVQTKHSFVPKVGITNTKSAFYIPPSIKKFGGV